mgnify:FL=1|jgi:hypothetical protein
MVGLLIPSAFAGIVDVSLKRNEEILKQNSLFDIEQCSASMSLEHSEACKKFPNTTQREERLNYIKQLEEKKKQEEYLKSPEYKQKLLEEKQKELEAKQAELEKRQKELEAKAEAKVEKSFSSEAELAKSALGSKTSILESLVPIIKSKDEATQKKVSLILETFKASKDEYTRNVGIYLDYLLK